MTVTSSSAEGDPALAGIRAVVLALPQPALVTDAHGHIHCANAEAAQLLGGGCPALTKAVLIPETQVLRRLRRMARTNVPSFLRLEFPGSPPVIFQGAKLADMGARAHGLILLVADKASALLGKFINLKSASQSARRELDKARRRQRALHCEAAQLKRLSDTDPLTGLLNVRIFESRVRHALAEDDGQGSLIFIDLNDFKRVNDLYGHDAGNRALCHVAAVLRRAVAAGTLSARVGGDEFAQWRPGPCPWQAEMLGRLRARISEPLQLRDSSGGVAEIRIGAALGAARFPCDATEFDALRRLADHRMYANKAGKSITGRVLNECLQMKGGR